MPEGDTIFKLAAHLGPALQGRELLPDSAVAGVRADLAGRRIGEVFAHGKHLFIELDDAFFYIIVLILFIVIKPQQAAGVHLRIPLGLFQQRGCQLRVISL